MSDGIQISAADIETFHDDGAVALRGVFDLRWLDSLAIGVEKNFADPGPDACHYTPEGAPGGFYDDYCNWERIEEYRNFAMASPAAEIVGRLMGSSRVRFLPRACVGERAWYSRDHSLAPRPAVLRLGG